MIKENELNEVCEECKEKEETVTQNMLMYGFKICESCRLSKTIYPI